MVQVIWRKNALKDLEQLLEGAYTEYGQTIMNHHILLLAQSTKGLCRSLMGHERES